tara:strand:- start:118278 stop:118382 length:105 start_codon:yes stop_codon:yes gene_type:complete
MKAWLFGWDHNLASKIIIVGVERVMLKNVLLTRL